MRRIGVGVGGVLCAALAVKPLVLLGESLAMSLTPVVDSGFHPVDFVQPITWWAFPMLLVWFFALVLPLIVGETTIFLVSRRLYR